jgi:hypothetical protein
MTAAHPRVSVIVPTYQRRELVRRAIASAIAQTLRDFELIVVDDGSSDGTRELFEAAGDLDGRLRYEWQPNLGPAAARNRGLRLARAEIVAFLDSDDHWLPNHLAVVTEVLRERPDAVLVSTCPKFILAGRERFAQASLVDYRETLLGEAAAAGFMPCVAVRRAAILEAGAFDERLEAMEDSDLLRRLATIGPFALIRRHTVIAQTTVGSLRERAQRSGHYLAAAEFSAQNLATAVDRLPEPERTRLSPQARGHVHMARAMRALDRGERETVRTELERACRVLELSDDPRVLAHRVRAHQPGFEDPKVRLRMLETLVEAWPEPQATTERYLRAWGIAVALRLRHGRRAARLAAGWRWRGTIAFLNRVRPIVRHRVRRVLQDRRHRERD